jgi:ATP-binding protein involved in chromosome partitioning
MAQAPNPFETQNAIPGVKHIIAVASGKGGVGKSTVASNLAVSLAKKLKVGLLDADIYGPSVPRMLGCLKQKPEVDADNKIQPLVRHGTKLMSIGFLVEEDAAIVWRGPMLFKAIDQFLRDVDWGDLDVLIVDLPPGTGDVQLSLAQKVPLSGAIIVTTPQNVALADVKKSIDMFKRINTPILGLVENMSYFLQGTEKIEMFPKGELKSYLETSKIPKLAEIPFHTPVSFGGEMGIPVVISQPEAESAKAFEALANNVLELLGNH